MRASVIAVLVSAVILLGACSGTLGRTNEEITEFGYHALNLDLVERDYTVDPTRRYMDVSLKRIMANPTAFLGLDVRFNVILRDLDGDRYEAYYSSMSPQKFYGMSVWPEGAKLWTEEGFGSSINTLYVSKVHPRLERFISLKKYQVIQISGTVISDFHNEPWIEARNVSVVAAPVYTDTSLQGVVRGTTQNEDNDNASAIRNLESTLGQALPDEALHSVHLQLGDLYFGRGGVSRELSDFRTAIRHYATAASLLRDDEGAMNSLRSAEQALEREIQIREAKRLEEERKAEEERQRLIEEERKRREAERMKKNPK